MDSSKYQKFFEAAIEKTKNGVLLWERVQPGSLNDSNLDVSRSFRCSFAGGKMLLAMSKTSGLPLCFISPDRNFPYQQIKGDDDCDEGCVLRLYNVVYSSFPSVDSFMDAMINSPNDPEELPF
nr:MAG TPA: hypothetical protein [Caudoviricetes sp.]